MLATAGFVVWAVASSGSGGQRGTTVRIGRGLLPSSSPIAERLANGIVRANLGPRFHALQMTAVAPFAWERAYVFRDTTRDDIRRRLGFDWPDAPDTVPRSGEHESLVVFVRGRQVAGSAFLADAVGHLDCLTAPRGYARGTRFTVRFTARHDPYVAASPPSGADIACLRAVRVR